MSPYSEIAYSFVERPSSKREVISEVAARASISYHLPSSSDPANEDIIASP
jgi:hypothetical protein